MVSPWRWCSDLTTPYYRNTMLVLAVIVHRRKCAQMGGAPSMHAFHQVLGAPSSTTCGVGTCVDSPVGTRGTVLPARCLGKQVPLGEAGGASRPQHTPRVSQINIVG